MSGISEFNPIGRFTGLARIYARCRPSYPDTALDFIVSHCRLGPAATLVDVGSGTGIASRLFARRGIRVIGLEPNSEMRAEAAAAELPADVPRPTYVDGRGEATGLASETADVVLAAQSFHWFEAEPALAEFHRILKLSGWVVLMWNDREASDPFTAEYGKLILTVPDAAAAEVPRGGAGKALFVSPLFEQAEFRGFRNEQVLDHDSFVGRAFSASYAPREGAPAHAYEQSLRQLFSRYENRGRVTLRYETRVYVARRKVGR
jgi:SAM-dependent methyltransferase